MENVFWMAITPKRGFSMMKKSEFLSGLFQASLQVVWEYNAEGVDKKMFNWIDKSAAQAESHNLLSLDERGLGTNPVLKAVEAFARHKVSSLRSAVLEIEHLPLIEEAWEHYQEQYP